MTETTARTGMKEVTITRVFDAPRDVVFRAWSDPKQVEQWWGPAQFTNQVREWQARHDGPIHIYMIGPDGTVYPTTGVFQEVEAPEKMVLITEAFPDSAGESRLEGYTVVTFDAEPDNQTRVTIRARLTKVAPDVADAAEGMEAGWQESLDKLEQLLQKRRSSM